MLKKLKLKIALWFINTEDELRAEINQLANIADYDYAYRTRGQFIILNKLSTKLSEEIVNTEELIKEHENGSIVMVNDLKDILTKKYLLQTEYTKKLFAFHGMFEAYKIPRIKPEELK